MGSRRSRDANLADRAVLEDDCFEPHHALNLGPHRFRGVIGLHLAEQARLSDAVAWSVRAAAEPAAVTRTETGSRARTAARTAARSRPAVGTDSLRDRGGNHRGDRARQLFHSRRDRLGRNRDLLLLFGRLGSLKFWRLRHRDGDLRFVGKLSFPRGFGGLVAPASATATGARLRDPHDVLERHRGLTIRSRDDWQREDEEDEESQHEVRDERHAECVAKAHGVALAGFEGTGQEARVRARTLVDLWHDLLRVRRCYSHCG